MVPLFSRKNKKPFEEMLLCAYYAGFACCNADTWASEVGTLSTNKPFLITNFRRVPYGTNGGVSFLGCLMSFLGGMVIGFGVFVLDILWYFLVADIKD